MVFRAFSASALLSKLVKLADKICNLRDLNSSTPVGWSAVRIQEYFDWAKQVVDNIRGISLDLEAAFDGAFAKKSV